MTLRPLPPEGVITSPCVGVCAMDPQTGMCIGCLRTLAEIGGWRMMDLEDKKAVLARCREREKTIARRERL